MPEPVVTVTLSVPLPAGEVAVHEVGLPQLNVAALDDPNFTALTEIKLVPVIVTNVPPAVPPDVGRTDDTVGFVLTGKLPCSQRACARLTAATIMKRAVASLLSFTAGIRKC